MAVGHRDLAFHLAVGQLRLQGDRLDGGREDPADGAQQATGFVERGRKAAERLGQPDQDEIAEGVAFELTLAEAVFERVRPDPVVARQRDEATPDVARRRHAQIPP